MKKRKLTSEHLGGYRNYLRREERSPATIEKYIRDVEEFSRWLKGRAVTKETAVLWKAHLLDQGLMPVTVNTKLSALNGLFRFLGWAECRIKFLKIQRRIFREDSRALTREEYRRLLDTARARGRDQLALLMETICAAGMRVSELRYITVEAARRGRAEISLKGKVRTILLPGKLCRKLIKYASKQKIALGEIFLTRDGRSLSRKQIWKEMKMLCSGAGVKASKVFPHNLRHLFATTFYRTSRDIVKLADLLGHSSINTTRIYLLSTSAEHIRELERLELIT
ncbi:MAG: tyrosine-type recombinase/integrase [Lawsonibacter sp.]|jgi:integrase/recombinase XerD|nr:tyrosine-type recombinase/integrase [Lawsonibacter sp.]